MKAGLVGCIFAAVQAATACSCNMPSVQEAKKYADIVFRGTITEIKNGTVFFRVARKWKGNVSRNFPMPEFRETSACLGFWPDFLTVGKDLLVYAQRLPPSSKDGAYFTSICTRTREAKDARTDFFWLGFGSKPSN
jgi:hypothetical protein